MNELLQCYRFVYNKVLLKVKVVMALVILSIWCLTRILMSELNMPEHFFIISIVAVVFIGFWAFLIYFLGRKRCFIVDAEGMRFSSLINHPFHTPLPTCMKWSELQAIRYFSGAKLLTGTRFVLFKDKHSQWHTLFLMIGAYYRYVGEDHGFSFDELLCQFYGTIEEITNEEMKEVPLLRYFSLSNPESGDG